MCGTPSRTPIIATTGQHLIDRLASTGAFIKKEGGGGEAREVSGTERGLRRKCEVEEVCVLVWVGRMEDWRLPGLPSM